jgi:hypothetical protein
MNQIANRIEAGGKFSSSAAPWKQTAKISSREYETSRIASNRSAEHCSARINGVSGGAMLRAPIESCFLQAFQHVLRYGCQPKRRKNRAFDVSTVMLTREMKTQDEKIFPRVARAMFFPGSTFNFHFCPR